LPTMALTMAEKTTKTKINQCGSANIKRKTKMTINLHGMATIWVEAAAAKERKTTINQFVIIL